MVELKTHPELLIFSQTRWDCLAQRSKNLVLRESKIRKIYFFEEATFSQTQRPFLKIKDADQDLQILTPHLPQQIHPENICAFMRDLVDKLIYSEDLIHYSLWYFDAMAVTFTDHLEPLSMQFVSIESSDQEKKSPYSHFSAQYFSMSGAF